MEGSGTLLPATYFRGSCCTTVMRTDGHCFQGGMFRFVHIHAVFWVLAGARVVVHEVHHVQRGFRSSSLHQKRSFCDGMQCRCTLEE